MTTIGYGITRIETKKGSSTSWGIETTKKLDVRLKALLVAKIRRISLQDTNMHPVLVKVDGRIGKVIYSTCRQRRRMPPSTENSLPFSIAVCLAEWNLPRVASNRTAASIDVIFAFFYALWKHGTYFALNVGIWQAKTLLVLVLRAFEHLIKRSRFRYSTVEIQKGIVVAQGGFSYSICVRFLHGSFSQRLR